MPVLCGCQSKTTAETGFSCTGLDKCIAHSGRFREFKKRSSVADSEITKRLLQLFNQILRDSSHFSRSDEGKKSSFLKIEEQSDFNF